MTAVGVEPTPGAFTSRVVGIASRWRRRMNNDPARAVTPAVESFDAAPTTEIPIDPSMFGGRDVGAGQGVAPAVEVVADGLPAEEPPTGGFPPGPPGPPGRWRFFAAPRWRRYPPGAVFIVALLAVLTVGFALRTLITVGEGFHPEDESDQPFPRRPSGASVVAEPAPPAGSVAASVNVNRSSSATPSARPTGSAPFVAPPPSPPPDGRSTVGQTVGQPSVATTAVVPPGDRLVGIADKCAEVAGGSPADGTPILLGTCTGAAGQLWHRPGDGTVRSLDRCLGLQSPRSENRIAVQLFACNGSAAQIWQLQGNGTLRNALANRCLDADSANTADGTKLLIYDCHGRANQRWRFG